MDKKLITREAVFRVLRQYWKQYKLYPTHTAISFFLPAIGTTLILFVPPLIIAKLINTFSAGGEISVSSVGPYVILFASVWLVGEIFWRIAMHFVIRLETCAQKNLYMEAFNTLTARDYDFFSNNFVGSLTKKAGGYVRGFETLTDTVVFNVVTSIIPIIFASIVLWQYSPVIPILLLSCIAVSLTVGIPIVRRRSKLVALRHESSSKLVGRLSDSLTNILVIKSFAKEKIENKNFKEHVDDYSMHYKKAADYQNLRFDMVMSPIYVFTNIIGLVSAIFFAHTLGLPAGTLVVVFSYYTNISGMFWQMNGVYKHIESAISESAEFTQLTIDPPAVEDVVSAGTLHVIKAQISFENIDFKYGKESNNLFLNGFNLDIKSNQRVGLVGPSGGGKTTITKLLLRFINLDSGSIKIDGQDIGKVSQKSLRDAIAYVPQEPLLFHRTLFENIAYGDENATEAQVMEAARLARATEFIEKLPKGYQTLVGERGIKLSGGQRQRIAIARAILKHAPILVLDEATSALDSESEKYIQEGLKELMKDKTALVIAHRLSTIKHLDRIIVLNDGKVVQDGTHDELVKQKGLYAILWGHQSGEFLVD